MISVVETKKVGVVMKLDNNNHSVFLLHYHLVLVVKCRQKVLNDIISNRLKEIFENIAPNYNINIVEWNYNVDHVHALIKGHPNTELSKFINAYKSASSRLIKKEFPYIRSSLWQEMFWSKSFCLLTAGDVTVDTIRHYVETQGEKQTNNK